MNSMREEFERDSAKKPQDLEREIDATRAHMEHTLDLLERKLSPGEIVDEVLSLARRRGGSFASNLTDQVQNNPIPTLLTGVGLAWLMSASDRPSGNGHRRAGLRESMDRSSSAMSSATQHMREGAHGAGEHAHEMGERARGAAADAGRRLHETADSLRGRLGEARQSADLGSRRAFSEFDRMLHEQPLMLAGIGIALGAALGAAVPPTRAENELLGRYSDQAKRQAAEAGGRQYERARRTAERAATAAGEEVSRESQQPGA